MSIPKTHNFLLIGLPSTGKTSFLAALWYAVQQRVTATGLILKQLDGDSSYLNAIRTAWLTYKPVGRNPTDSEKVVSMWLKRQGVDEEAHLTFPDVSGESFKEQWISRHLPVSYKECLKTANGALLFIHPASIVQPLRITEVDDLAALIDDEVAAEPTEPVTSSPPPTPWSVEKAPTQVQLVELLQFLKQHATFQPSFPLAVVVSAWDLLQSSKLSPEDWIKVQLPLLYQFLSANVDSFTTNFYGVSAQGGKYEGAELAVLQSKNPAERIEIVGEDIKNKHDITEPLQWLMQ